MLTSCDVQYIDHIYPVFKNSWYNFTEKKPCLDLFFQDDSTEIVEILGN